MSTKLKKSLLDEHMNVQYTINLIAAGAKVQMIKALVSDLSTRRIETLFTELSDVRSRGALPWSAGWYQSIERSMHGSLFMACLEKVRESAPESEHESTIYITAYNLYTEMAAADVRGQYKPVMDITRCWILDRSVSSGVMSMKKCKHCEGRFVTDTYEEVRTQDFYCLVCMPRKPGPKAGYDKSELFEVTRAGSPIPKSYFHNYQGDLPQEAQ